jgi:hypothetical protein
MGVKPDGSMRFLRQVNIVNEVVLYGIVSEGNTIRRVEK